MSGRYSLGNAVINTAVTKQIEPPYFLIDNQAFEIGFPFADFTSEINRLRALVEKLVAAIEI